MTWYYEFNGAQKGPVSETELDALIAQGVVRPVTLVWRDGLPNWTPLSQARATAAPIGLAAPVEGTTQCDSCGLFFNPTDVVQISGRNVCAGCKPMVLQSLQQGSGLNDLNDAARTGPAWEHRETLGFYVAARDTIKGALFRPSETFRTMKTSGGINNPFWFHTIFAGLGTFVFLAIIGLAVLIGLSASPEMRDKFPLPSALVILLIFFGVGIWVFVSVSINAFLHSGILHLCLMLCGGARRPYEATFRAYCYGSGSVLLLNCIPVLGTLASIPWSLVVTCIGVARAHNTDIWRVVLALFLPSLVCCGMELVFFAIGAGANQFQHH